MDRMTNEKCSIESDFQDLLHQQDEVQEKYQVACLESKHLAEQLTEAKIHGEAALRALLEACFKSAEKLALRAISDNDRLASGTPTYFLMIAEELKDILTKLELVHVSYVKDNSQNVESLARKVIIGGHLLATAHVQGLAVCNSSADIELGERKFDF
jgi:translation elongation factor EF-Ts